MLETWQEIRSVRGVMCLSESVTFGARLRSLRAARGISADALARRLAAHGIDVTGSAITGWEREEYGNRRRNQQRREVVEALDAELEADGELLAAYGENGTSKSLPERVSALEEQIAGLRDDLNRLLQHPQRRGRGGRQ